MEILWKGAVSAEFRKIHPKLCGNCALPQNYFFVQCPSYFITTLQFISNIFPRVIVHLFLNFHKHLRWNAFQQRSTILIVFSFYRCRKATHLMCLWGILDTSLKFFHCLLLYIPFLSEFPTPQLTHDVNWNYIFLKNF